jgi:opacity protein-like surface antigen
MKLRTSLLLSTAVALLGGGQAMGGDAAIWEGGYLGATLGYGWGTILYYGTTPNPVAGPTLGVQAGYNFGLTDGVVVGFEGDLNWTNETGTYPSNSNATSHIDWDGSVRGRLGFAAGQLLPYLEGGLAVATSTEDYSGTVYPLEGPLVGWVAGAGVEFMVSDALSLNLEYRYSSYGETNFVGYSGGVSLTNSEVRLGANLHY